MPPRVMVQQVGVSVSVWVTGTLWAPDLGRKEENQQENQARRAAFISEQYMTLSCLTVFLLERLSGKQKWSVCYSVPRIIFELIQQL